MCWVELPTTSDVMWRYFDTSCLRERNEQIREFLPHIKRERVHVEKDQRMWRHQNMCTL